MWGRDLDPQALDRYITGNYGQDQYEVEEDEDADPEEKDLYLDQQSFRSEIDLDPDEPEPLSTVDLLWYNDYLDQIRARNEQSGAEEKEGDPVDDYEGELPW